MNIEKPDFVWGFCIFEGLKLCLTVILDQPVIVYHRVSLSLTDKLSILFKTFVPSIHGGIDSQHYLQ